MGGSSPFQSGTGIRIGSGCKWQTMATGRVRSGLPRLGLPPKQQVTEATKSSLPKTQEGQRQKASKGRTKRAGWQQQALLLSAWGPCTARGRRLISACRTPVCLPPCREAWCREASGTYHQTTKTFTIWTHTQEFTAFVIQQLTQGQLQMLMGPGLNLCH